ncbi:MAG: transporter substrate-binding domain-containing protein [Gammaproteobacteria bacterium]|nr:transporter substrate-binding domain-containing protein [Gammaproteobacteria bacterium]
MLIIVWVLLAFNANAQDIGVETKQSPIKIASLKDFAPLSFVDQQGNPQGFLLDYWRLWAKKVNRSIVFVPMTLHESKLALQQKTVDMHIGLFKFTALQDYIDFVAPIYPTKSHIFIKASRRPLMTSMDDLNGKRLGIVTGFHLNQYMKQHYPLIKLINYISSKALIEALDNGEIDAFVNGSVLTWFQMVKVMNFHQYTKIADFEVITRLHSVVVKGNSSLLTLIKQGMSTISVNEITKTENKWIINEQLRASTLTKSEQRWLREHPNVEIATTFDWPPFIFLDAKGNDAGYNVDLIATINSNIGSNFKVKRYRYWQDGLNDVKTSKIGGILSLSWSKERAKNFNYSSTYYFDLHKIIVRVGNRNIKNFSDLNGQRIAVIKDYMITNMLKQDMPSAKLVYVNNPEGAYKKIANGQADVALFSHPNQKVLTRYGLKITGNFYTKAGEYAIGSSKSNPILSSIFAKGVNSITSQQSELLLKEWFNKSQTQSSIFNAAELHYIKENPQVIVGAELWQPIVFSDGREVSGIVGDLLRQVSKISGLKFKPIVKPWIELVTDFKAGEIDLLPASYMKNREEYGLFGDGFINISSSIYRLKDNQTISSFEDLRGLKLGITAGDAAIDFVKQQFPTINIVTFSSINDSIDLLVKGKIDAIFEIKAVMDHILSSTLTGQIQEIKQYEIFDRKLYFWSAKKQPLLQSILKKSMNYIPESLRKNIIKNWLGGAEHKKSIKVVFGLGREPFTLNKSHLKGIEYDLLKRIFDAKSIDISQTKNLPLGMLNSALKDYPELDAAITVKKNKKGYFYSDEFVRFNNVAVSLRENKFEFNSLSDLKNKQVLAFTGALKYLGPQYNKVFTASQYDGLYQEITYQRQQLDALINGNVDVIIIDKTIFSWFLSQLGYRTMDSFQLDDVLVNSINSYSVAFRNRHLRDTFNEGLAELKKSGAYQHIIDGYAQGLVIPKIELTSIISSLVAPFIFGDEQDRVNLIINKFSKLSYIDNIEIFNNQGELLHQTSVEAFNFYQQFDSFSWLNNVTEKVGFIRVFFNDSEVKKQLISANLMPDIDYFKQHRDYQSIKEIYQRYGYLEQKINFNLQEQMYLNQQPTLTFSEVNWFPLAMIKDNNFSGLTADYMNIVAKKTGIKFKLKPLENWMEVVKNFKNKQLDFLPGVANLEQYHAIGLLSDQYAYFKFAIVMEAKSAFVSDSNDLKGKTIALSKGSSAYYYIKERYPSATVIDVTTIEQALSMVRSGSADAFVEHLAVVVNQLEHAFSDLRMVGLLDSGYSHRMMVQPDQKVLLGIINKVIAAIPLAKHQEIHDRWIKTEIKTAVDYRMFYQLISGFLLILLLISVVVRKIAHAKKEVERAHLELERSFSNLQQTQQHLVESEKMASLGGLVAGIAHEINTPVGIGLTAITYFLGITETLEQKYRDKKMSQSEFEEYLKSSIESAQIINRNLERTAQLVRSFKQISVDQSSDERRLFHVKKYIEEIQLSIFHLTKKTNITIKVDCDENLMIDSYPGALSQILSNFMINSTIHAYPNNEYGTISIKVEEQDGVIKLTYTDDGAGIPIQNIKKIFNPFFTTNRENGGSGLGLNIIYNIVTNRLKGKIECRSDVGKYTEFMIVFTPLNRGS